MQGARAALARVVTFWWLRFLIVDEYAMGKL
jgi:hypothetical protein